MNGAAVVSPTGHSSPAAVRPVGIVGTGNVGGTVLELLAERDREELYLHALANSRRMFLPRRALLADGIRKRLDAAGRSTDLEAFAGHLADCGPEPVVVDLTASPEVAERHRRWLEQGLSVVTANKWAAAGEARTYRNLVNAAERAGTRYRHATTVGAGLPVIDSLYRLRGAGDKVLAVAGLFSGTLTYLMHAVADGRKLSTALLEARERGLTEPDPRLDLAGTDVARKLVIVARAAGFELELSDVEVESLVPPELEAVEPDDFFAGIERLDSHWTTLAGRQAGAGLLPRYVGELDARGTARVGVRWVADDDPLAHVGETDNIFEIRTRSYRDTPMIIRGPGAGARVTAVQVLSDVVSTLSG